MRWLVDDFFMAVSMNVKPGLSVSKVMGGLQTGKQ
jgi:hypothetical protein